ncbi:MAG: glycosyltransferase family 4 protein [Fimbriimonadaceae bacterium]|nr:glycosyltransferase family 4 protein [Fimbriimonadaceae bacterium]QYK57009.1 MAG: glycosyltransferase family 4 protein [Fimbriimonadaceae bacterium]
MPPNPIRAVLSSPSKFHFFDLARELLRRGSLSAVITGYPITKLRGEEIPLNLIKSYPYFHLIYRGMMALGIDLEYYDKAVFDQFSARALPQCDVFMAMAGSAYRTGLTAKKRGIRFVLDRPCSHIETQNALLREEGEREGIPFKGIDAGVIRRELKEYDEADLITVPSTFALNSFLERGFDRNRLRLIPYGIDLSKFFPTEPPDPERFDVIFVGGVMLRKGVPHLLRAFERVRHDRKSLTLIGNINKEMQPLLNEYASKMSVVATGHIKQSELKDHMSKSHVLVLPSIEDGYGVVMSQAMACGTPVIATDHTGAAMLFEDGKEGFIVPVRDDEALTYRLQTLASDHGLQRQMAQAAQTRVAQIGGWTKYGDDIEAMFREII